MPMRSRQKERARRRSSVRSRAAGGASETEIDRSGAEPSSGAGESAGTRRDERRSRSPAGRADRGLSSLRAKPSAAQEVVLRVEVQDLYPGRTTMASRRRPDDAEIKKPERD